MCDVLFVVPSKVPSAYQECSGSLLLATILRESGINADIYRFYEADMSKSFGDFKNFKSFSFISIIYNFNLYVFCSFA